MIEIRVAISVAIAGLAARCAAIGEPEATLAVVANVGSVGTAECIQDSGDKGGGKEDYLRIY